MLIAFSPNNVLLYMSWNSAFIHVIIVLVILFFFKSAKFLGAPRTLGAPGLCPAQLIVCDATEHAMHRVPSGPIKVRTLGVLLTLNHVSLPGVTRLSEKVAKRFKQDVRCDCHEQAWISWGILWHCGMSSWMHIIPSACSMLADVHADVERPLSYILSHH